MLTDADCRNATCPADLKRLRKSDSAGLYLEVSPAGAKRWFWKFYPDGKESRLALVAAEPPAPPGSHETIPPPPAPRAAVVQWIERAPPKR